MAKSLARQGYDTHIIEKESQLGGQAQNLYRTAKGEDIQDKLSNLIAEIEGHEKIHVHLDTEIADVEGFVGNFETTLSSRNRGAKRTSTRFTMSWIVVRLRAYSRSRLTTSPQVRSGSRNRWAISNRS